jgi:hypothetical protein
MPEMTALPIPKLITHIRLCRQHRSRFTYLIVAHDGNEAEATIDLPIVDIGFAFLSNPAGHRVSARNIIDRSRYCRCERTGFYWKSPARQIPAFTYTPDHVALAPTSIGFNSGMPIKNYNMCSRLRFA